MIKTYLTKSQKARQDTQFQIDDAIYNLQIAYKDLKRQITKLELDTIIKKLQNGKSL